jgi:hypothetical protein
MRAMTDQPQAETPTAQSALGEARLESRERPLPLRQMGIGELVDGAIKLYRRDWLTLTGIAALALVPVTFIQVWVTQVLVGSLDEFASEAEFQAMTTQVILVTIVFVAVQLLIVQPFLVAAISRAAADAYLGERVTLGRTLRYALSRLPAILWITIITAVLTIIGFMVFIIPGIIAAIRLSLTPAVLVVEDVRGTKAVGRSWRLTAGHFWRVLGTLILSGLIGAIGAAIIQIPTETISTMVGPEGWPVSALGSVLASVLITPFSLLIVVLLYFDLRVRKEGFDIEVMAQELAPVS